MPVYWQICSGSEFRHNVITALNTWNIFFVEEDISPNDIGPHKSFNIPGTVSKPSVPQTNRQTDTEVLAKLQELYNER